MSLLMHIRFIFLKSHEGLTTDTVLKTPIRLPMPHIKVLGFEILTLGSSK